MICCDVLDKKSNDYQQKRLLDAFNRLTPTQQGEIIGRAYFLAEQNFLSAKRAHITVFSNGRNKND